jgi:hypothetical protein
MSARHRHIYALGLLSVALGIGHGSAARAQGDPGADHGGASAASQPGSWQQHDYQFNYMGFTATYSCDGLADKLQLLLRLSGASPAAKVIPFCSRGFGVPDKLAQATVTFATLKPAPSDTGGGDANIDGVWRHVEFSPHHPSELQLGDCELVEQFRDRLLPLFATRNLQNQISCVPYQESGSNFILSFDVLVPAPPPPAPSAGAPQPVAPPPAAPARGGA